MTTQTMTTQTMTAKTMTAKTTATNTTTSKTKRTKTTTATKTTTLKSTEMTTTANENDHFIITSVNLRVQVCDYRAVLHSCDVLNPDLNERQFTK